MNKKENGPTGQGEAKERTLKSNACDKKSSSNTKVTQAKSTKQSGKSKPKKAKIQLINPEPWPDPVEGLDLLDQIKSTFLRYLSLPDGAAEAMALFVVFTHAFEAAEISPRLALMSPVPGCGKTTALTVLSHLVRRPLPASNWTAATVFRSIERDCPTLLIDEADTFLAGAEGLRGILNSGHTQEMAFVMRSVGEDHQPHQFSTWAPMAIAKIGRFPATIEERSIMVQMQKRRPDEEIERFRPGRVADLKALARKAARWAEDHLDALRQADPKMPESMSDRIADNWRPLFTIADAVGGHWPDTARYTALRLSSGSKDPSPEVQVLADICAAFKDSGEDRLPSETLGKKVGFKPHLLARRLQPFGIKPRVIRFNLKTLRGYKLSYFEDAFARYLPRESATPQQTNKINGLGESPPATSSNDVAGD